MGNPCGKRPYGPWNNPQVQQSSVLTADNTYRVVELTRISATTGQFSRRSTTRTSPFPNRSPASVNLVEELLIFDECIVGGRAIVHAPLVAVLEGHRFDKQHFPRRILETISASASVAGALNEPTSLSCTSPQLIPRHHAFQSKTTHYIARRSALLLNTILVERRRIELPTFALRTRRSPS